MPFKRVFHSNGIASKLLIRTKYSAPVKFLFCNVLHDFSLPSSDNMSRTVRKPFLRTLFLNKGFPFIHINLLFQIISFSMSGKVTTGDFL